MTYQVIARKYRPQGFDEIIGQQPIVRTLKNALEQDLVAHAYIFSGMRGVGKTTTARILAKALNCAKAQKPTTEPCGQCPPCTEIASATAVDVLEIDAASNRGVDEIRQLRETVRYLPARDRYKIFIIDEAHMLTTEAFNALLKTLEEPPARVLFILATTEPHRIPATIHSRCQSFHFRSVSFAEILRVLARVAKQEGVKTEAEALAVMARVAEGSLRDALSSLDQAIAYCGETITAQQARELFGVVSEDVLEQLVDAIRQQSSEQMLRLVDALVHEGYNLQHFCREAIRHLRNLLVVRVGGEAAALAEAAGGERTRLEAVARHFSEEDLLRFFHVLLRTEGELRWAPQPRLHLELGLLKLVQAERLVPLEEVLAELRNSPSAISRVSNPAPASRPARPGAASSAEAPTPRRQATPAPAPSPAASQSALPPETVEAIKSQLHERSRFLGSFVDQVIEWEKLPGALNLWFEPDNRALAEMLDRKQQALLEKIVAQALGETVKVSAKVGARAAGKAQAAEPGNKNPVVQALLERFGGTVRLGSETGPARRGKSRS